MLMTTKFKIRPQKNFLFNLNKSNSKATNFEFIVRRWTCVVKHLSKFFNIDICGDLFETIQNRYLSLLRANGLKYTIQYFKDTRLCVFQYVSTNPITTLDKMRLTHDGIPAWLQD